MKKIGLILVGIFLALLVFVIMPVGGWLAGGYNGMVTQQKSVEYSWSQVETQYQRRYDLIPNLANATKGFLVQERGILESIAEARTRYAGSPSGSPAQVQAAGQLEGFLARLLIVVENYPTLKSDATVKALMDELAGTENRVTVARERYNEVTRTYNTHIATFPNNLLAGFFHFEAKPLFESLKEAEKPPVVDLQPEEAATTAK